MSKKISLKTIAGSLKFIIVAMGLCAFAIQSVISLMLIVSDAEEIDAIRIPWMAFLWSTAIPMIPALIYSWKTASNIGKNKAFCLDNAKNLKNIAISSISDAALVLVGNIVYLLLDISHPSVLLFSCVIVLVGIAIFIAAMGLSQLIRNAAELQEETELTI
ncbi:MAG TPA: DUF2975 domain-containing protein [Ruminococcaceae bacterium]|nr:DUF2975 domain-containing protein [Oscillospiraceae bacterium]